VAFSNFIGILWKEDSSTDNQYTLFLAAATCMLREDYLDDHWDLDMASMFEGGVWWLLMVFESATKGIGRRLSVGFIVAYGDIVSHTILDTIIRT
jgi:hypothetical protein